MDIEIKSVITLEDDKDYLVTSYAEYQGELYYYLVDINENSNIKFCKHVKQNGEVKLLEITDDAIIASIVPSLIATINEEVAS